MNKQDESKKAGIPPATPRTHWVPLVEILLAACLVLVGIGQVIIYNRQAGIMQTQANIAADQNEIATSVQRAFVTVTSFTAPVRLGDEPGQQGQQTKHWWYIPTVRNSGNTPTKNLKYYIMATCPAELAIGIGAHMAIDCDFTRRPEPIDPEVSLKKPLPNANGQNIEKLSTAVVGPQTAIPLGGIGITERSLEAIRKGFPLFVEGVVFYNDIFPDTPLHITKFCYQIHSYLSEKAELETSYDFCPHWNCADDECQTDREAQQREAAADKPVSPPEASKPNQDGR